MEFLKTFKLSVAAGIVIGIGGTVYLSCTNKIAGAFLFGVGLFCICNFGLNLFTGKIGYVIDNRNKPNCFTVWLGNLCGCAITALTVRFAKPDLVANAAGMVDKKLALGLPQVIILGFFCGILMYIAVDSFKYGSDGFGKNLGILLCVPTFILCGFEHSVADMYYCILGVTSLDSAVKCLLFVAAVSLANGLGAVVFRYISRKKELTAKS